MRKLAEFAAHRRSKITAVLTDIDDTVTTDGRLTAQAYRALELLQQAGLLVIPITGRPAGGAVMLHSPGAVASAAELV